MRKRDEPYRWAELATYNAERARGLVHTDEWQERMLRQQLEFNASGGPVSPSGIAREWDPRRAFLVDELACPECGTLNVLGYLLVNALGEHMHTRYVCTYWPSGSAGKWCGWQGWSVPGWDAGLDRDEVGT